MASLTGNSIAGTYIGLLKTIDNGVISITPTTITDGAGNTSSLSLSSNSAIITGSVNVVGSITSTSITSSLFGTASQALNAITASYVLNAVSASFASTASYVLNAVSASFASTASFIPTSSLTSNFFVQGGNSFNTQAVLGTNDVQNFTFETNGLTRMFISSSGNVGINTTSPGAKLDVNGDVYVSPNTAGKNTFILSTNASNDARLLMRSDVTTKVDIQANGISYFNGGNIGIGTTTPTASLDISGSLRATSDSITFPGVVALNFANDTAASSSGIPVGGLYRSGSILMIRAV